jgi:hypothetical protein
MTPVWLHPKNWGEKKNTHSKLLLHIIIINLKINTLIIIIIIIKYTCDHDDDDDAAAQHCLCFLVIKFIT